jgi:UDP-glucose 4-epimerase
VVAVVVERGLIGWGKCEQGFRRMAARKKPAGIRSLVYGMTKGKAVIEGLSVSGAHGLAWVLGAYTPDMPIQTWLITGGAGYIGSHVADAFLASGREVVVYDSLRQGLESRIAYLREKYQKNVPLIVADIRDTPKFEEVLNIHKPYGIAHTAALKSVTESVAKPLEYFEVNLDATRKILELMDKHDINNFIFSSTAAVYGNPDHSNPVKESDEKNPISPYGASKLAAEFEVAKFLNEAGRHGTSLRFFNAIGTGAPELLDNSVANLVPIVINKLKSADPLVIYGTDYSTPDGTCIRDYVDVRDIAGAHLVIADRKEPLPRSLNVGTGLGSSVRQIIKVICDATGRNEVEVLDYDRRIGDAAVLVADVSLLRSVAAFSSKYSLESSIRSLF